MFQVAQANLPGWYISFFTFERRLHLHYFLFLLEMMAFPSAFVSLLQSMFYTMCLRATAPIRMRRDPVFASTSPWSQRSAPKTKSPPVLQKPKSTSDTFVHRCDKCLICP